MRSARKFSLPVTMVLLFALTCLLYRLDQRAWEEDHHTGLVKWHEDPYCGDCYEGYPGPDWIGVLYLLQLPGLIPVTAFAEPMPLYIYATWYIYCADLLSICGTWFVVGAWLDRRYKRQPPRFISLSLAVSNYPSDFEPVPR